MSPPPSNPDAPVDVHEPSVAAGYDRWASTYDTDGNPLLALEGRTLPDLLGPVADLDLLELGTGTGRVALALSGAGARVTALDLSAGMLRVARTKPGAARARFIQADLGAPLPLTPASFDRAVCCLVLDHIADLEGFFHSAHRALRPGGALTLTVMHPAMTLRNSQARFVDEATGERVHVASHPHGIADYLNAALAADFAPKRLVEASPDEALARQLPRATKYIGWPMLLGLQLDKPATNPG